VIVYGRNPVMEALRGRRAARVRDVWATPRAAREPFLEGIPVRETSAEEIESRCGSAAHQGICAEAGAYPYTSAEELLAGQAPLIVALDQIQDPQNLGRDPGAAGRRGDRGRLQGIGGRRRAPAAGEDPQHGRFPRPGAGRRLLVLWSKRA
jgi:23S rRNA (guanosine2251-2'-O)-methyltransferase